MTLVQFFDRLLSKVESHPGLDIDLGSMYAVNTARIQLRHKLKSLRSYAAMSAGIQLASQETIRSQWRGVVRLTKRTDFFSEFNGREDLRELIRDFIGSINYA